MKTVTQIVQDIVSDGLAKTNEELEVQFDYFAAKEGYTDEQIKQEKGSPWFPWLKQ